MYEKKKSGRKHHVATEQVADMDDYETHQDLDAVVRHHAIKKDSERMKRVHELAARKLDENKGKMAEAKHAIKLGSKSGDN
jgi:hypothetical protein